MTWHPRQALTKCSAASAKHLDSAENIWFEMGKLCFLTARGSRRVQYPSHPDVMQAYRLRLSELPWMLPVSGQFSSGPAFLFRLGFDIPRTSEIMDRKHSAVKHYQTQLFVISIILRDMSEQNLAVFAIICCREGWCARDVRTRSCVHLISLGMLVIINIRMPAVSGDLCRALCVSKAEEMKNTPGGGGRNIVCLWSTLWTKIKNNERQLRPTVLNGIYFGHFEWLNHSAVTRGLICWLNMRGRLDGVFDINMQAMHALSSPALSCAVLLSLLSNSHYSL